MRSELNSAVSGGVPGTPAATELCLACVGLLGVDGVAVSMVHEGASRGTFGSSSETSRRLDEYQFTFGEGPCLDAVTTRNAVLAPDLDGSGEHRWPAFAEAVLDEGIHAVFALPIMITSVCVGALDLFRVSAGPLDGNQLAGALIAAELASAPLLDIIAASGDADDLDDDLLSDGEAGWGFLADVDRIEVYQATGMVMSQLGVSSTDALVRIRAHAVASGQTASQVAWAIVERRLVLERDDRGTGGETR
jgi:hypothetical protein